MMDDVLRKICLLGQKGVQKGRLRNIWIEVVMEDLKGMEITFWRVYSYLVNYNDIV